MTEQKTTYNAGRRGPPRPPAPPTPPMTPATQATKRVTFGKPAAQAGRRVCLYGPGGIGKTTLATAMHGKTVVFDLDGSLPQIGADVATVEARNWKEMREALAADGWDGVQNVVIDSGTVAQEFAERHTYENVPGDKGLKCQRLEDYGYGKGYRHVYDAFCLLLADLDKHATAGRNVMLVCHEALFRVTNPAGEDYLRHEPKLQDAGDGGKSSIKLRVRDWCDSLLVILPDIVVDSASGKAKGAGTRTLYSELSPYWLAKHRGQPVEPVEVTLDNGVDVWNQILGK